MADPKKSGPTPVRGAHAQLPITLDGAEKTTLQNRIFDQIRAMILGGQLRGGDTLPTTRELAQQLRISRNTAVLAYERLIAEGYIQTRPYVGTFVSPGIPDASRLAVANAAAPSETPDSGAEPQAATDARPLRVHSIVNPNRRGLVADFWLGRPDPQSFPLAAWSQHIRNRLKSACSILTEYNDPVGLLELRQVIAKHLGPARGVTVDPDQIVIVGGCQDGYNLISRLLVTPGCPGVVESPCYQGAAYVLESFGATLHPVPVDRDGLDVSKLPDVKGAVVYVTPSHQYPMGVTLSLQRRLALIAWAASHDSYIIEDDYDSDFCFVGSPLTALKGLDFSERVIYMGTFSKSMGPGLRLGYVVFPKRLAKAAGRLKTLMNNGQGWLEQAAMVDFMKSGGFGRHLRRIRRVYRARRDALIAALQKHFGEVEIFGEQAGMHLAWRLPDGFPPASEVEATALRAGVGVYGLASGSACHFGADAESERFIVMGFAALTEREIEDGVARLARALKQNEPSIAPRPPTAARAPAAAMSD